MAKRSTVRKAARKAAAKRSGSRRPASRKTASRKAAARKKSVAKKLTARRKSAKRATAHRPQGLSGRYGSVTAHLVVNGADGAIAFYRRAFGATELWRIPAPDGRVLHAEMQIGGSKVMLCDEFPEHGGDRSPASLGGTAVTLHLHVPDATAVFARAIEAGCTMTMPLADMFWGDRYGQLRDPFGHKWSIGQHLRDVPPAEIEAAVKEAFA